MKRVAVFGNAGGGKSTLFAAPAGWPKDGPLWSNSLSSYRVIGRCHRHLTPKYRRLIDESASTKRVHHLRSRAEIETFVDSLDREHARA